MNEPVRFLSLSDSRSGTMMLNNMLEQHPAVRLHNLYSRDTEIQENRSANYHYSWKTFQWQELPQGVTHLGTTMHRVDHDWIRQWTAFSPSRYWAMLADSHSRTICLRRENLLRRFLSIKVGAKLYTLDVLTPRESKGDPGPIVLPLVGFSEFVVETYRLHDEIDSQLPGRLDVTYEALARDPQGIITEVQEYLRLPVLNLPVVTFRQETRPLSMAVSNYYSEIMDWCRTNGHSDWLEE